MKNPLRDKSEQLGPNHVYIAASCCNLAQVHQALGDFQQAKHYYERP